ncbi:MAG: hypothetical protein KBB83_02825 [Alphaproteobacteria bacterium]|nr:hypothetical protein [Alphaproteobacteria bacterium]
MKTTHAIISLFSWLMISDAMATAEIIEKDPLIIDSANGMKCDREKQTCSTEGKIKISKGVYEIHGESATAFMGKNPEGKSNIRRVEIHKNVQIFGESGEKSAAEHAIYDLDTLTIELKPNGSKQVIVWKDEYILLADKITIYLKENTENKNEVDHILARGHVKVSSPEEFILSDEATMTPQENLIIMTGNVLANREEGQLQGPYALVDLEKKTSSVLKRKDMDDNERVRAFVYPDNQSSGKS